MAGKFVRNQLTMLALLGTAVLCAHAQPEAISDLVASAPAVEGRITLQWTSPDPCDANPAPGAYIVRYATSDINAADWDAVWVSTVSQSWVIASSGTAESHTIDGLTPGVTFYFAVAAVDSLGVRGDWNSSEDSGGLANTGNRAKVYDADPAVVAGFQTAAGDTFVDVSWQANTEIDIVQYIIERSTWSDNDGFDYLTAVLSPGLTCHDTDVINGTTYYYRMRAEDAAFHQSVFSPVVSAFPWVDLVPPAFVTELSSACAPGSIRWTWTNVPGAKGYRVVNSTSGVNLSGTLGQTTTTWLQTGLTPNAPSSVHIESFSGFLLSSSTVKQLYTLAAVPGSVTVNRASRSIGLSWQSNSNPAETRYTVKCSTTAGFANESVRMSLARSTTHQDSGLAEGVTYYYRIWAVNEDSVTIDADFTPLTTDTLRIPPAPPYINTFSVSGTNDGEVSLCWNTPYDDEGDSVSGDCSSFLVKYATYTLTENAFAATTNCVNVPAGVVAPNPQTAVITGLYPGTTYFFALKAIDKAGTYSLLSNTYTVVSRDNPPPVPTSVNAIAVGAVNTLISWTLPAFTGYDDRARYVVYRATFAFAGYGSSVSSFTVAHPGANYTDSGLTAETSYYYRVSCQDTGSSGDFAGTALESPLSNPIAVVRTPDLTSPAPVSDLKASTGTAEGSILLTWRSPGDDGSANAITGGRFRIDYGTDSAKNYALSSYQLEIPTTTFPNEINYLQIGSFTPGATYYFRAWTADEAGNWSSISNGATSWAQIDVTAPAAITSISYQVRWRQMSFSWTAPGDDGASGALNGAFEIRASTVSAIDNDTKWNATLTGLPYRVVIATSCAAGSANKYTLTGLTNGYQYHFALRSADECGNLSPISTVLPYGTPMNNPPASFGLTGPSDDFLSTNGLPTLSWTPSNDADTVYGDTITYVVELATSSGFTNSASQQMTVTSCAPDLRMYEDKTVYWRVLAKDCDGTSAPCSDTYFRIRINQFNTAPASFGLASPAPGEIVASAAPTLTWNASSDVDPGDTLTYQLDYSARQDFASFSSSAGITGTTLSLSGLTENATFFWRVWAWDGTARTLCGTTYYFRINAIPQPPAGFNLTSPLSNAVLSTTSVTFVWSPATDPDPNETVSYELVYSPSPLFASSVTVSGLLDPTTSLAGLNDNSIYYWMVTAVGSDGQRRTSNQTWRLYTDTVKEQPGDFDLLSPAYGVTISTTVRPLFSWSPAIDPDPADDVRYIIDISPNPDFTGLGTMAVDRGTDRYYSPLIDLTDQTTYYWRVRAAGYQGSPIPEMVDAGYTCSSTGTFIISMNNNPPQSFTLAGPANDAGVATKRPRFTWQQALDPDVDSYVTYAIFIATSADFAVAVESSTGIPAREYTTISPLRENRRYYWKVIAVDNKGAETPAVSTFTFTLPVLNVPRAPTGLAGTLSEDRLQFTLVWSTVTRNADGTAIDDLQGYEIYRGLSPQSMSRYAAVSAGTNSWTDIDTQGGNIYYRVRAIDTSGIVNAIEDSPLISSLSGGAQTLLTEDNVLSVEVPAEVTQNLRAGSNGREYDLSIIFEHDAASEDDHTLSSYRIKVVNEAGTAVDRVEFSRAITLRFNYAALASAPRRAVRKAAAVTPGQLNIFWNNGIEYLRVGGVVEESEGFIAVQTINPGQYQLRAVSRAQAFGVSGINPPKIFTPGVAPYETIVFYVDNPEGDKAVGRIYDLKGEWVADLSPRGDPTATSIVFEWDGRNADGAAARKGVYLYQIEGSGKVVNGTIMVAR